MGIAALACFRLHVAMVRRFLSLFLLLSENTTSVLAETQMKCTYGFDNKVILITLKSVHAHIRYARVRDRHRDNTSRVVDSWLKQNTQNCCVTESNFLARSTNASVTYKLSYSYRTTNLAMTVGLIKQQTAFVKLWSVFDNVRSVVYIQTVVSLVRHFVTKQREVMTRFPTKCHRAPQNTAEHLKSAQIHRNLLQFTTTNRKSAQLKSCEAHNQLFHNSLYFVAYIILRNKQVMW